jgi:hypothetical protein
LKAAGIYSKIIFANPISTPTTGSGAGVVGANVNDAKKSGKPTTTSGGVKVLKMELFGSIFSLLLVCFFQ